MKKIAILEDDEQQSEALAAFLSGTAEYEVAGAAQNGIEGLELIERTKPDVILLDLIMPAIDGFSVLDYLKEHGTGAKIIVMSAFGSAETVTKAIKKGAAYFILKPFEQRMLKARMDELFSEEVKAPQNYLSASLGRPNKVNSLDEKISNIFITVGIPPHIKGYGYLREGVKMAIKTPEIINSITKKLYPQIGEKYDTSASKVERAIRHAIEVAWNRGRIETINTLFGVKAYMGSEKPANGEFIALVADKMLLEGA